MIKTIEKNGLKISLDTDFLLYCKQCLLSHIEDGSFTEFVNKKGLELSEADYEDAVERLYQLALDIMDDKKRENGLNIFEYLPLTKAGKFHKKNPILLATSGIKDIWNQDYFSMYMMDLRLIPHCSNDYPYESDGLSADIHLGFYSHNTGKEVPIFDGNNHPAKVQPTQYIKKTDLKIGSVYKDIKGIKYMYVGQYYSAYCKEGTKKEYMQTEDYNLISQRIRPDGEPLIPRYYYIKMTKKMETFLTKNNLKTVDDLWKYCYENKDMTILFKMYQSPLRFVEDCNESPIEDVFTKDFYEKEKNARYGSLYILKW